MFGRPEQAHVYTPQDEVDALVDYLHYDIKPPQDISTKVGTVTYAMKSPDEIAEINHQAQIHNTALQRAAIIKKEEALARKSNGEPNFRRRLTDKVVLIYQAVRIRG